MLHTHRLNDAELKRAGELLPVEPKSRTLLRWIYTNDLAEQVRMPKAIRERVGDDSDNLKDSLLDALQPSGWHMLITARD